MLLIENKTGGPIIKVLKITETTYNNPTDANNSHYKP